VAGLYSYFLAEDSYWYLNILLIYFSSFEIPAWVIPNVVLFIYLVLHDDVFSDNIGLCWHCPR